MISNIGRQDLMVRIVMETQKKVITVIAHHKDTTVNVKKIIITSKECLRTCVMITMDLIVMAIMLMERIIGAKIQLTLFILLILDRVEDYLRKKSHKTKLIKLKIII